MSFTVLLSALIAQSPSVEPSPQVVEEIFVIGRRLKGWSGRIRPQGGRDVCVTLKSTGDREIDAIGCRAMYECFPPLKARFLASGDSKLPRAERKRIQDAAGRDLGACVGPKREQLVEQLAELRWQARQGPNNAAN